MAGQYNFGDVDASSTPARSFGASATGGAAFGAATGGAATSASVFGNGSSSGGGLSGLSALSSQGGQACPPKIEAFLGQQKTVWQEALTLSDEQMKQRNWPLGVRCHIFHLAMLQTKAQSINIKADEDT